jgi:hypothetical protein
MDEFTDRPIAEVFATRGSASDQGSKRSSLDDDGEIDQAEVKPRLTFSPKVKVEVLVRLYALNRERST